MPDSGNRDKTTAGDMTNGVTFWPTVKEFAIHIAVGMTVFLLIATAAVLIDILVTFLTQQGINDVILGGLKLAEYSIFGIDVLLLIAYVGSIAIQTIRDLWRAG